MDIRKRQFCKRERENNMCEYVEELEFQNECLKRLLLLPPQILLFRLYFNGNSWITYFTNILE